MFGWLNKFIDFVLPPRCLICGRIVNFDNKVCSECFAGITFITPPYCSRCGVPLAKVIDDDILCINCLNNKSIFRFSRSMVVYDEFSKKVILDFKFSDHLENTELLVNWLDIAGKDIFDKGVDLILPVPLHFTRIMKRKYNQSAILAKELSKRRNIPVSFDCLKRIKKTKPQVQCSGKNRKKNVKGAFEVVNNNIIRGKRIVLIDDVYTTGSTLKECAKVLLKAGAKSIDTLTVARVC